MDLSYKFPPPARVRRADDAEPAALRHTDPGHIDARPFRDDHTNINGHSTANPHA